MAITEASPDWPDILRRLAEPFPVDAVQWRPGATNRDKSKAIALAYVDMREYQRRLDDVVGAAWELHFVPWGEQQIIAELSIHGRVRSSTGNGDSKDVEVGTSAEAQAVKRACAAWGLGRYLYDLPLVWAPYDDQKKCLLETPKLSSKHQPAKVQHSRPAEPASASAAKAETLPPERAQALAKTLEKLGYDEGLMLLAASEALSRDVNALTELTEAEGVEVWSYARANAPVSRVNSDQLDLIASLAKEKRIEDADVMRVARTIHSGLRQLAELSRDEAEQIIARLKKLEVAL